MGLTAAEMMPYPDWDLAETRRIILEHLSDYLSHNLSVGSVRVYLFGSHAKKTAHRTSDIDVAILPESPLPAGLLSDVREALEQSNILYHVDLVDLFNADAVFRQKVLDEGVLWSD